MHEQPERLLPIDGTLNFRDIGGYPTKGGRRVRWRTVFRSDSLAQIEATGWERLNELGIREIFDLRYEAEREQAPYEAPAALGIAATTLAIGPKQAEPRDLIELLRAGGEDDFGLDYMIEMYGKLLDEHAPVFGLLLTHLADTDRLPAVFHCTAGKDRTGIGAALLLSVLGVDRETVLDDYELSNEFRSKRRIEVLRPRLEEAGIDIERVRPYLSAPRPALEAALAAMDLEHGGVDGFLVERAGVQGETLTALREVLLER